MRRWNWSLQDDGAFDPIEPINRKVYTFNSDVDALLGKPLALVYSSLGEDVRAPLANFYGNLGEPKNVVNHVLQTKRQRRRQRPGALSL